MTHSLDNRPTSSAPPAAPTTDQTPKASLTMHTVFMVLMLMFIFALAFVFGVNYFFNAFNLTSFGNSTFCTAQAVNCYTVAG